MCTCTHGKYGAATEHGRVAKDHDLHGKGGDRRGKVLSEIDARTGARGLN